MVAWFPGTKGAGSSRKRRAREDRGPILGLVLALNRYVDGTVYAPR